MKASWGGGHEADIGRKKNSEIVGKTNWQQNHHRSSSLVTIPPLTT